jgi:hypothetical protein
MPKETEQVPTGFEVVRQTPYGSDAGLNSGKPGVDCNVVFRRPGEGRPFLTGLTVVCTDREPVSTACTLVNKTVGGFDVDISKSSGGRAVYLGCTKCREEHHLRELFVSLPPILDICVINECKGEEVPCGYIKVDKNVNADSWFRTVGMYTWYTIN